MAKWDSIASLVKKDFCATKEISGSVDDYTNGIKSFTSTRCRALKEQLLSRFNMTDTKVKFDFKVILPEELSSVDYLFNKEMMNDLGEEYPYQTVLDGKWTYDKMLALAEKAAMDLDGDGATTGADRFGLLSTEYESLQWLAYGMGYLITVPDADGIVYSE